MVSIEQKNIFNTHQLRVSYISKEQNLEILEITIPDDELFKWTKCSERDRDKDPIYKHFIDGGAVKKTKTNYLNKYRVIEFLESLNTETKELIYNNNLPRIFFCDIENSKDPVTKEWPKPENPTGEITAISLVDSIDSKVYVLGLKKLSSDDVIKMEKDINTHFSTLHDFPNNVKLNYFYFENESQLLYAFWSKFMKKIYFITGWNFTCYDWPYLMNRSGKLFLDPFELMGVKKYNELQPYHKIIVDYLKLYKKFDYKILKENFTLDYTASQVLKGIKKVKYNGTLDSLYIQDPYKFYLYNAIDSFLVKLIDESLNLSSLYILLGNSTKAEAHTLLGTIQPVENIIARYYLEDNMVLIPDGKLNNSEAYDGGFVFEPTPGLYKWVLAMDFASLYPSVQRQFNISPETFRGIDFERELLDGEIRLPNGAIFDNSKDSVFRKYLRDFYQKRKDSKKIKLAIEQEIFKLKQILNDEV